MELRIKRQEQMQKRQQEQTEKKVQEEKIKQETRLQKIRAQEESRKLEIRERQAQAQALAKAKAEKERILNQTGMSIRAKEALIRAETKKAMEEAFEWALKAIKSLGITNQHRKTFSPINKIK